jgi:hypothetical protein
MERMIQSTYGMFLQTPLWEPPLTTRGSLFMSRTLALKAGAAPVTPSDTVRWGDGSLRARTLSDRFNSGRNASQFCNSGRNASQFCNSGRNASQFCFCDSVNDILFLMVRLLQCFPQLACNQVVKSSSLPTKLLPLLLETIGLSLFTRI